MTKFTPDNLRHTFAVYQVSDESGTPIYIGQETLANVYRLIPLMKNPAFDATKPYTVTILQTVQGRAHAYNAASAHIKQVFGDKTPFFILTSSYNLHGTIVCEQTGEIFYKQSDICRKYKCSPSQLSNHIRRMTGYNSVCGMTFRRADYYKEGMEMHKSERAPTAPMYKPHSSKRQAIRCEQTGEVFESQKEACVKFGLNTGQMSRHMQRQKGCHTIKGMVFTPVAAVPSLAPLHPVQTVGYP